MLNLRTALTLTIAVIGLALVADPAFAAGTPFTKLDSLLNTIITALTSTTGRLIATIALIVIAFTWLTGRIFWHTALLWAVGVGIIVGAPAVVTALA